MLLDKFIPFIFSNATHIMQGLALQKENIELKKEVSIAHRHMMELQKKVRGCTIKYYCTTYCVVYT
jgi:hypothetical protein